MATEIYLGKPPQYVIDWIKAHLQPAAHEETWYKYAGDTEWSITNLKGQILKFEGGISSTDGDGYIENDTSIAAIEIGTDVTSIMDYTFSGCSGLTSMTIPDSVTSIGEGAFQECSGLTSVTITSNGGNAENVKQMMIAAGVSPSIAWDMPAHEETWYKYDGDTEWRTVMLGGTIQLKDEYGDESTGQIENPYGIVAIEIGTGTQANPVTNIG